jgi:hypothetical protein
MKPRQGEGTKTRPFVTMVSVLSIDGGSRLDVVRVFLTGGTARSEKLRLLDFGDSPLSV